MLLVKKAVKKKEEQTLKIKVCPSSIRKTNAMQF